MPVILTGNETKINESNETAPTLLFEETKGPDRRFATKPICGTVSTYNQKRNLSDTPR
jgi:hypothetical protein